MVEKGSQLCIPDIRIYVMDGAINCSQSDFSDASVASLGRSIQTDDLSESSYLLPGSIQTAHAERRPGYPVLQCFKSSVIWH